MRLKKWEDLPEYMKTPEVKKYYDILSHKKFTLFVKRLFDIVASLLAIIILSPVLIITAIVIKAESEGPAMYRQVRITTNGREFRIHKFRSMYVNSDKGSLLTVHHDSRITPVGAFIRKYKIDELGQLFDVLKGDMTFVGVRPQVPKYVNIYTEEMKATLLLPAGITSMASIYYRNENDLLSASVNPDKLYIEEILPDKMSYNLTGVKNVGILYDLKIILMTVLTVFGKDYKPAKQVNSPLFNSKLREEQEVKANNE